MGTELQIISIDVNCVSEPVHNVDYFRSVDDEKSGPIRNPAERHTLSTSLLIDVLPLNWTY